MIEAFDYWITREDPRFRIRELQSIVKLLLGGSPDLCHFAPNKNCGRYFAVTNDLRLVFCDEYSWRPEFRLGPVEELAASQGVQSRLDAMYDTLARQSSPRPFESDAAVLLDGHCKKHRGLGNSPLLGAYSQIARHIEQYLYASV
jgi:sulfatase maturation enzyme AslB (radical SAM superfamily)